METKKYIDPEMEVTKFQEEDVITTSGGGGFVDENGFINTPDDDFLP